MKFRDRRRQNLRAALRWNAVLLCAAAALVGAAVIPLLAGWWDAAWPAAVASATAALLVFAVLVNAPLEAVAYVALYADREIPTPPRGFGRALYKLEALSRFESPDPLQTREPPVWHEAHDALPTLDRLIKDAGPELRPHLEYLRSVLEKGGKFYFMVNTWAGGTNARVEALRRGDMSVIAPR